MLETIILATIVGGYLGFQVGTIYTLFKLRDVLNKHPEFQVVGIQQPEVSKLFVEQHYNIFYLFDFNKNTFICQAQTIEELANIANKHNKINHALVLDKKTNTIHKFVDGKVYEGQN